MPKINGKNLKYYSCAFHTDWVCDGRIDINNNVEESSSSPIRTFSFSFCFMYTHILMALLQQKFPFQLCQRSILLFVRRNCLIFFFFFAKYVAFICNMIAVIFDIFCTFV